MVHLFALIISTSLTGVVLDQPSLELGPHSLYLEDTTGEITIRQVRAGEVDAQFQKHERDVPNFGLSNSIYWFKVNVENRLDTERLVFSNRYGLIDNFEFYLDLPGIEGSPQFGGDHLKFSKRYRNHKSIHFPLEIPRGQTATLYIRAQTNGSMQLPMVIETEYAFDNFTLADTSLWVLFYGVMLAMCIYHLLLYISLREIQYALCAGFLLLIVLTNAALNGDTLRYLFPNNPYWGNMTVLPSLAFSSSFFFLFSTSFLDVYRWSSRWYKTLISLFYFYAGLSVLAFFIDYNLAARLIAPLVILSPLVVTTVAFQRWRNGYRPARFFLLAWPIFLGGTILSGLQKKGFLPSTFIFDVIQVGGGMIAALLIAFALADKIQILQRERRETARALASSHKQLEIALAEAREANTLKSHFLANMSHEVRTPLNALLNLPPLVLQAISCDFLWECKACSIQFKDETLKSMDDERAAHCPDCGDPMYVVAFQPQEVSLPEQRTMLARVEESANELNNILSVVLDYAQIEAGFLKLANERVNARDLIHDAVVLAADKNKNDIKPELDLDIEQSLWIACDEAYILNVLMHLFDNAYKFSPDGSRVSVSFAKAEVDPGMVQFTISDEGPGISEEAQKVVFEGFRQVEMGHTRTHRGSGLGLAICKGIVEEHGGKIWIENRIQGGTSVSFTVPLYH